MKPLHCDKPLRTGKPATDSASFYGFKKRLSFLLKKELTMQWKKTTLATLLLISVSTTACAGLVGESMFTGEEEGRLLLSTDRAGLEAFGDMVTGLVTTGKATPDGDDAHHELRREQNKTKALKFSIRKGVKK